MTGTGIGICRFNSQVAAVIDFEKIFPPFFLRLLEVLHQVKDFALPVLQENINMTSDMR